MFNLKLIALACAMAVSACAHDAWQPPSSDHPADPAAQAGSTTNITSLQRYRASQAETDPAAQPATKADEDAEQDEPAAHRHGDHMEDAQ
jgi:predicted RNA polymerase sigma factor